MMKFFTFFCVVYLLHYLAMADENARKLKTYEVTLANQIGRNDYLLNAFEDLAKMDIVFTAEEINLFATGFKLAVENSLEGSQSLKEIEEAEKSADKKETVKNFRSKLENEVIRFCTNAADIIESFIVQAHDSSSKVIALTLKGEYYHYYARVRVNTEDFELYAEHAKGYFKHAMDIGEKDLSATSKALLQLAVSYSTFLFEMNDLMTAIRIAKNVYDGANVMAERGIPISDESRRLIAELKKNLNSWTS